MERIDARRRSFGRSFAAAATLAAATPVSRVRRSILEEVFLLMALSILWGPNDRWLVD